MSSRRGRPGVGGREVSPSKACRTCGGKTPETPHPYSDTICQRMSSPRSRSPGHLPWPEWGGDNKCPWGRCHPPTSEIQALAFHSTLGVSRDRTPARPRARCPLDSAQKRPGRGGLRVWMEFSQRVAKQFAGHRLSLG